MNELNVSEIEIVSGGDEMTHQWGEWVGEAVRWMLLHTPTSGSTTYLN